MFMCQTKQSLIKKNLLPLVIISAVKFSILRNTFPWKNKKEVVKAFVEDIVPYLETLILS